MDDRRVPGRPRPVADPVLAAVAARPDEVARRWLLALLESGPLAEAASVPVESLARDGPEFCAAVLAAVGSDDSLTALLAPGAAPAASELTRLSGAAGGPGAVSAAEGLRRAVLQSAAAELPHGEAAVLADLGDRLAHVCAQLAAATLSGTVSERRAPPAVEPPPEASDAPPPTAPRALRAEPSDPQAAPLWLAALERQVADGGRFGLLLVELDGADRLRLAEGPDEARELFAKAAAAVRGRVRRSDVLAHEDDGRIWLIAPDAGRSDAVSLATRVADAVEGAASSRGAPLTASIGVALYPDDGRTGDELTAQAEEGALGAQAAGVRVIGADPDEPAASGPRLVP